MTPDGETLHPDRIVDPESFVRYARSDSHLPLPGAGATAERLAALRAVSAVNPSTGRLLEAHEDAVAILHEAGAPVPQGSALAVWASAAGPGVTLGGTSDELVVDGVQRFAGGASLVDAAIVNVRSVDGDRLVLVDLAAPGVSVDTTVWRLDAFREAGVCTVGFDAVPVGADQLIGPPGFYLRRPGFWQGAIGVAAGWAGMVDRLVEHRARRDGDLALVTDGHVRAATWALDAYLGHAARSVDAHPTGDAGATALACRHQVANEGHAVLRLLQDEAGPGPLAFDADFAQICHELHLALRQCHGDRDLVLLAGSPG